MLVFTAMAVALAVPHAMAAAPPSSGAREVAGDDLRRAVLEAWRASALEQKVPRPTIDSCAELLEDVLRAEVFHVSQEALAEITKSLPSLVATNTKEFGADTWTKGSGHFLVFCLADAFRRAEKPPSGEELQKVEASYASCVRLAAEKVAANLLNRLPKEDAGKWRGTVSEASRTLERQLADNIKQLQSNALFPGFRRSLGAASRDSFLARFEQADAYPKYDEPPQVMTTKDEWYRQQLRGFVAQQSVEALFWLAMEDLTPKLRFNPYFGHTLVFGTAHLSGSSGEWPIALRMQPNTRKNAENGWKRGAK